MKPIVVAVTVSSVFTLFVSLKVLDSDREYYLDREANRDRLDVELLRMALEIYWEEHKRYPESLSDLVRGEYIVDFPLLKSMVYTVDLDGSDYRLESNADDSVSKFKAE